MTSTLQKHYQERLKLYGPDFRAVQYSTQESQFKRFKILADILPEQTVSIADMGCGLGDLLHYVRSTRGKKDPYLGLDCLPEFIEIADKRFLNDPNGRFLQFDTRLDSYPEGYDYFFVSGMFNNDVKDNTEWMKESITKMFQAARQGIAFNALSTYVDYLDEGLYYSDPLEMIDFCKKTLTRKLSLRHEYLLKKGSIPYEYTIYLYH